MPLHKISNLLKNREFISVATCDLSGNPNAAPKLLLKLEGNSIYLVDYTIGKTWQNLKINPRVSLSAVDTEALIGYQINGDVEIIEEGREYDKILSEVLAREVSLSAKRIIEGVTSGQKHKNFELESSGRFVVFKVKIKEIAEIGQRGELKRERV